MRKPRGAAFKGSFRYKRTLKHYGKRKVVTAQEPAAGGLVTHLYEPRYQADNTLGIEGIRYSYVTEHDAITHHE